MQFNLCNAIHSVETICSPSVPYTAGSRLNSVLAKYTNSIQVWVWLNNKTQPPRCQLHSAINCHVPPLQVTKVIDSQWLVIHITNQNVRRANCFFFYNFCNENIVLFGNTYSPKNCVQTWGEWDVRSESSLLFLPIGLPPTHIYVKNIQKDGYLKIPANC